MNMGRQQRFLHQYTEDTPLDGRRIHLDGRELLSFGSCSYLGLETDPRMKEGVIRAVERWGTQFSASRAYLSAPPYRELEERLSRIFDAYVLPTSTTTLGHLSAVPVLCQEKDVILLDRMVHHSVQLAATQARAQGTHVELVRHGDWAGLAQLVERFAPLHRRVWYLFDGVYSMFGDLPDIGELQRLLAAFPNLYLYCDDAHGMSIAGEHGRGMHLSRMGWHDRMVLATSLNKAYASAGGCLVFRDPELRDRVRLCGGPFTFGGPVQPPMLGAALASAAIHLSPEIDVFQQDLREKVQFLNQELLRHGLPLLEQNTTPIFFIKGGPIRLTYAVVRRLAEEGFYLTIATYPAVPLKRSGVRLSITRHHTREDLSALAQALGHHYPKALEEVGLTRADVEREFEVHSAQQERARLNRTSRLFDLGEHSETMVRALKAVDVGPKVDLAFEHHTSAAALDAAEWDALVGHRSNFNHATLVAFERIFRDRPEPESNWGWHYFVVRHQGKPVAATFFTDALWKDDMLMRAEVSERIEQQRASDPYFLTSRAMGMGCLLSEGNHLFLDRGGPWRQALAAIIEEAAKVQREVGATSLVFRDLPEGDAEFDQAMLEHGLVKMPMLAGHVLDLSTWTTEDEFFATLGNRTRRRVRHEVKDVEPKFTVKLWRKGVDPAPSPAEFAHFYALYKKVKDRKRRLNTFDLPKDIMERLWESPGWELLSLHLAPEAGGPADGSAVAMGLSLRNGERMVAVVAGLDGVEREVSVYRQLLWQVLKRAKAAGARWLELGMDAEREKTRLGAEPRPQCSYAQLTDHYAAETMGQIAQDVALEGTK
ncbi:MAG: aminotransferase class I/II-fold pyridoxal phosphate-dependent enzyme [Myxococcota bacterium]